MEFSIVPSSENSKEIENREISGIAEIPEEEIWLASQKSVQTRRAYKNDVLDFLQCCQITDPNQLREVTHREVILWERKMARRRRLGAFYDTKAIIGLEFTLSAFERI